MIRLYALAGAAAVVIGLTGWALMERNGRLVARAEATEAARVAAANLQAVAELRAEHSRTVAALERTAADAERRAARSERIRRDIHAAPPTRACLDSPAVRALLDGLRHADRGPGGPAGDSGQPAQVQAEARGPGALD